ncbi:proline-rich receptor-like protein kinase PERK8 [Iris pallida]|uniref:Proline-rich receptor-like protein kinase PERK8 n=1 Tax=Iris pallida TaxID=29817 RepID=A0AAX6I2Y1_IRIPA|nr:proline-rich receptor-like protein kinase PERK8 [Iris pallida]
MPHWSSCPRPTQRRCRADPPASFEPDPVSLCSPRPDLVFLAAAALETSSPPQTLHRGATSSCAEPPGLPSEPDIADLTAPRHHQTGLRRCTSKPRRCAEFSRIEPPRLA